MALKLTPALKALFDAKNFATSPRSMKTGRHRSRPSGSRTTAST
jgi:hypothetical protein